MECTAVGKRLGRAAAVDSGAQGACEARLGGRLKQRRHRQWAAQAAMAQAKLGSGSGLLWDGGAGACGSAGETQGNGSSEAA